VANHTCQGCRERKARFRFRGRVKADRDHTLCFECYRATRERRRAELLAEVGRPQPLRSTPSLDEVRQLTAAEIAHRWRMLQHLRRTV
jgi:hypothetical protein